MRSRCHAARPPMTRLGLAVAAYLVGCSRPALAPTMPLDAFIAHLDTTVPRLMRAYNKMILAFGFFHADPHPGNILVFRGNDDQPEFILLDFGLAKELPKGFGLGLFELMFSMMTFNESAMLRAFKELGFKTKNDDPESLLLIARRMIGRSDTGSFQGEFTEEMTDEMFDAIRENPVVDVPTDFVLVARAFALLSGIAHTLDQRANALDALGPGV